MESSHPPKPPSRLRRVALAALVLALGAVALALILPHPVRLARLVLRDRGAALAMPVEGVRARDLRDSWGVPRSGGRQHHGIDIFARCGTPVLAATEGVVLRVGTNRLGGNVVWVFGPGAELHYYAHLTSFATRRGALVSAGDVLGTIGDTGNAKGTPCHLHYGLYLPPGGPVNPFPRLSAAR